MAFTLQTYVADPTLITGDVRLPAFIADPTLVVKGEFGEFIADPTAVLVSAKFPAYIADPTAVIAAAKFSAFIADPTLIPAGAFPEFILATPGGLPGAYKMLQGLSKSMTGIKGAAATASKSRQYLTKSMTGFSGLPKTLELFGKSMNGVVGVITTAFNTPKTLQGFTKSMQSYPFGGMVKQPQYATKTMQGVVGVVGASTKSLQGFISAKGGYVQVTGVSAKTLQLFGKAALGSISVGATYSTITMHTERQAFSTYTNFPFNSFAKFNNVFLGAGDGGLFALAGATDNGTPIDAVARTGYTDFQTSKLKRVDYMYIGYRTDGEMILRVFTDETTMREYLVTPTGKTGMSVQRVRIGKGVSARYWQFEIANKDGSDFDLNVMEFKPVVLARRIGGNA